MGKKTITRRAIKYAPFALTSQLNRALELEDEAEGGADTPTHRIPVPATARAKLIADLTATQEEIAAVQDEAAESVEPGPDQPDLDDLVTGS